MRRNAGRKKHSPQDDKDGKHRLVLIRHRRDGSISLQPCVLQFGHDRLMFHEADGRGEIVEEPGETTVIEIDDAEPLSVHEKVCKAQVGMNKAKAMALATIGIEPLR